MQIHLNLDVNLTDLIVLVVAVWVAMSRAAISTLREARSTLDPMPFRYAMFLRDGTDLDPFITAHHGWDVGDEVLIRPDLRYRIVAVVATPDEAPDDAPAALWVVERST